MVFNIALKKVKWRVVSVVDQIFNVLRHRNFEFSSGIALTNLKLAVFESIVQVTETPTILARPVFRNTFDYDGRALKLKSFPKVFLTYFTVVDALNIVAEWVPSFYLHRVVPQVHVLALSICQLGLLQQVIHDGSLLVIVVISLPLLNF